ncbi:MAG: sugar-transfer associated ATP-grasp domain-containing protein [Syntrophorhabdus sp.]
MSIIELLKSMNHYACHYAQMPRAFSDITPIARNGNGWVGKSRMSIILDVLYMFFILKLHPRNYYLFRFHLKSRSEFKKYIDAPNAPLLKHRLYKSLWAEDYTCLVNDKYIFHNYCRYHGIAVPRIYGILSMGSVVGTGESLAGIMRANGLERLILKPVGGGAGEGIHFATYSNGKLDVVPATKNDNKLGEPGIDKGDFVIQEIIRQHHDLERINPNSVNTIRIITLYTLDNKVEFLAAMLRTSSGRIPLDNFSTGGIVIKIDMGTGRLIGRGFMTDSYIREIASHPLTGITFHNYPIPHWDKVKRLAIRAQNIFCNIKAIGWDFAITPDGPTIIEGNIEWGTAGIQATNGGLLTPKNRKLFAQYGLKFDE